jgi:hypothetical protein
MPHRPVHTQPVPVDAAQLIKLFDPCLPQFEEDSRFHPFLKAFVGCRMRTQLGLVESLPRASGSQHVEDGIGTVSIRHPWSSEAFAMRVDMCGQQRLEYGPRLIADLISGRRAVIWRPISPSFRRFLFAHAFPFSRVGILGIDCLLYVRSCRSTPTLPKCKLTLT